MIPVQMIRVNVGASSEPIHVPVFLLPYPGGRDAAPAPGGFFVGKDGEYGVILDGRTPIEQIPRLATEEIRNNIDKLQGLVTAQFESLRQKAAESQQRAT
jgi:hypothetical protein